jgi:hypothetical protein
VAEKSPVNTNGSQRLLAYGVAVSIGLSLLAIAVSLALTAAGVDMTSGVGPFVLTLPIFSLPLGFVLIIALLITTNIQRGRASKDARN